MRLGRLRKHPARGLFDMLDSAGHLCVPNRAVPKRRRL